jgi:GH24 family phage-related lysozyme (muramidase)
MKDIRHILEKINENNSVNEGAALNRLGWAAALTASGALGVMGADAVIKSKRKQAQTIQQTQTPPQTQQTPAQTQQTPAQTPTETPTYADDAIREMVIQNEGLRLETYKDTRGIRTIGVGHNLEAPDSQNVFIKTFGTAGKQLHTNCLNGVCGLTKKQAQQLFNADYIKHRNQAVAYFPNLHKYPSGVQSVLVDATYRGHPGPKFVELVKHAETSKTTEELATRWEAAAAEYMNREEIKNPKLKEDGTPVAPGVIKRVTQHGTILDDFIRSLRTENQIIKYPNARVPTREPLGESCGCHMKNVKSRLRKKIIKKLEEARLDLNTGTDGSWNPDQVVDLGSSAESALAVMGPTPKGANEPGFSNIPRPSGLNPDDYDRRIEKHPNGTISVHHEQNTFRSIPGDESNFSIHSKEHPNGDWVHWMTNTDGQVLGVFISENPMFEGGVHWFKGGPESRGIHHIDEPAGSFVSKLQANGNAWKILREIGVRHMDDKGNMPNYGPNIRENRNNHGYLGSMVSSKFSERGPHDERGQTLRGVIFDHLEYLHQNGIRIPGGGE